MGGCRTYAHVEVGDHGVEEVGLADHVTVEDDQELARGVAGGALLARLLAQDGVVQVAGLGVVRHARDLLTRDVLDRHLHREGKEGRGFSGSEGKCERGKERPPIICASTNKLHAIAPLRPHRWS